MGPRAYPVMEYTVDGYCDSLNKNVTVVGITWSVLNIGSARTSASTHTERQSAETINRFHNI